MALLAVVRAADPVRPDPKKESGTAEPENLPSVARPGRRLNLPEIRRLLLQVPRGVRWVPAWFHWYRRQWMAQGCHGRRQDLKLPKAQLWY